MKDLVLEAVFGENKKRAQEKIKKRAQQKGIFLSSTQKLYEKIAKGEYKGFTVPAFNIRTLTFDISRALFRAAKREKTGAFIVELARSEMGYTEQSPEQYIACVLAAAIEEEFKGFLFLQGDHFKPNPGKLEDLIRKVIEAGFYNIDIDCSALPLKENFTQTAKFTSIIRKLEPKGLTISVGGEVGQIGGKNTTLEELQGFIAGYNEELLHFGKLKGLIKIAVQTGTSHGGILLPSGKFKVPEADFNTLTELSQESKKYGMAGAVQHGASTLPEKYFERFPDTGACEIHLATIFQNIIYDSPYFPQELREKIYTWLRNKFSGKRKSKETDTQFLYKFRKKASGIFKKEIWNIPQKNIDEICETLEEKFIFFFQELNVSVTSDLIKKIYSK
ncbi:class II fructose-bisphosphate aldolase [Patescibacteria group bacterium]|nr:class II fructose-bisphosphate aldolase [Patescibacteria group bacterium]